MDTNTKTEIPKTKFPDPNPFLASQYIEHIFQPIVLSTLKRINQRNDRNNLGFIISGIAAAEKYFPAVPELIADYFSITLTYNLSDELTPDINLLFNVGLEAIDTINQEINRYYSIIERKLQSDLRVLFGVNLAPTSPIPPLPPFKETDESLPPQRRLPTNAVFYVVVQDDQFLIKYALISAYDKHIKGDYNLVMINAAVFNPTTQLPNIFYHPEFTFDPILSRGRTLYPYFIPTINIKGQYYAGLGYVIWETLQLQRHFVDNQPYINKLQNQYLAMINALNNQNLSLSCQMLSNFIEDCSQQSDEDTCIVANRSYDLDQLINYGIRNGYFPNNDEFLETLRNNLNLGQICQLVRELDFIKIFKK